MKKGGERSPSFRDAPGITPPDTVAQTWSNLAPEGGPGSLGSLGGRAALSFTLCPARSLCPPRSIDPPMHTGLSLLRESLARSDFALVSDFRLYVCWPDCGADGTSPRGRGRGCVCLCPPSWPRAWHRVRAQYQLQSELMPLIGGFSPQEEPRLCHSSSVCLSQCTSPQGDGHCPLCAQAPTLLLAGGVGAWPHGRGVWVQRAAGRGFSGTECPLLSRASPECRSG